MKRLVKSTAALLTLLLVMFVSINVFAYNTGDDYPSQYKNRGISAVVDEWNFYNRQCTSFAAWCLNSRNGVAFHNYYGGVHWGNASNWGNAARSLGISVDNAPAVGAIAWWSTGYGHVAWVEAVNGGNVTIEEYNNPAGSGNYKRRTISASNPTGYIHIKDLGGGEPPSANLSINKTRINPNDSITFNFGGNNDGNRFTLGIYKEGERIDTVSVNGNTYTRSFADSGSYSAYMTAFNSTSYFDSNWVYWTVSPLTAVLSVNNTNFINGNQVIFNLSGNNSINEFTLGIYKYGERIETITVKGNEYSFIPPGIGSYSAYMTSYNESGLADSNWVYFDVHASDYVPTKINSRNNHIYALYDYEISWTLAKDLCEKLGGHLATITSAEENNIIADLIQQGLKDDYWLGASDIDRQEKDYTWITNENFSYSNWIEGEPNADGSGNKKEHYLEIYKSNYQWNDAFNANTANQGFILEIDTADIEPIYSETYNNNTYLLFDKNTTWTEAEYYCEMLGGHLAAVNSDEENEFIKNFLQNGDRAWYYLGAQKKDNNWQWIDGNNYSNITWNENAANWKGTRLMMYKTEKNCVGIDNAYFPESRIDNIGFVCEIEKEPEIPIKTRVITKTAAENLSLVNTVYAELENLAARDIGCDVIFVYKYADGSIAKTDVRTVTVPAKQTLNAESSVSNRIIDLGGNLVNSVEVYVWNSADGMIPLAEKKIGSFDYDY